MVTSKSVPLTAVELRNNYRRLFSDIMKIRVRNVSNDLELDLSFDKIHVKRKTWLKWHTIEIPSNSSEISWRIEDSFLVGELSYMVSLKCLEASLNIFLGFVPGKRDIKIIIYGNSTKRNHRFAVKIAQILLECMKIRIDRAVGMLRSRMINVEALQEERAQQSKLEKANRLNSLLKKDDFSRFNSFVTRDASSFTRRPSFQALRKNAPRRGGGG